MTKRVPWYLVDDAEARPSNSEDIAHVKQKNALSLIEMAHTGRSWGSEGGPGGVSRSGVIVLAAMLNAVTCVCGVRQILKFNPRLRQSFQWSCFQYADH